MIVGIKMHLFEKSQIQALDAMIAVVCMMVARLLTFYTQLVEGFFRGARKAALGSLFGSGNYLLNIAVGLVVLLMGYGVAAFAFSQLVIAIIYIIGYSVYGCRLINLQGYKGRILRCDINDIVKKGMGYLMTPVWQSVYFQGTTFVVRTVCRSVNQMFSIINASIFPDLQCEYGQGHIQTVHRYFRVAVLLSMIIGFAGCAVLVVFGLDLYGWWTKSVLTVPYSVWNVFMFGVFLNAVWWTSVVTYRMTNQPYHFAVASTLMSFVSVGLTYVLSYPFGLLGAAIGCTVFELVMAFYVLPDSCRLLGMKVQDLFTNIVNDINLIKTKFLKRKI